MSISLSSVKILRSHVIPLVLAFRLVGLSSADSLAIAATQLPELSQPIPFAANQTSLPDPLALENFLQATNEARVANGVSALQLSAKLNQAAQAKMNDMIANNYWDHFRPSDHKAPWDYIQEAGYRYHFAGENLARGFQTPKGITLAWLASPTHRENLLSQNYQEVGFATGLVLDADGHPLLITVQLFAAH